MSVDILDLKKKQHINTFLAQWNHFIGFAQSVGLGNKIFTEFNFPKKS